MHGVVSPVVGVGLFFVWSILLCDTQEYDDETYRSMVCNRGCGFVDGCLGMGCVALWRYAMALSVGRHKKTGLSDRTD